MDIDRIAQHQKCLGLASHHVLEVLVTVAIAGQAMNVRSAADPVSKMDWNVNVGAVSEPC